MTETIDVLRWARSEGQRNETIKLFWEKLCEAVNEPSNASAERVLSEIRAYGGNSFANAWRSEGVSYAEVAYDVADGLRGVFEQKTFKEGDILSCEGFVLSKMGVSATSIQTLQAAIKSFQKDSMVGTVVNTASRIYGVEHAAWIAAEQVASLAAQEAAKQAAAEASKRAARKAAEEAAKRVAAEVFQRIVLAVNVLLAAWTLVSIAGPATRVVIPAVTFVALLRQMHAAASQGLG